MTDKNSDMTPEELQAQKRRAWNIVADLRRKWKNGELTEEQIAQLEALGIAKHSRLDVVVGVNDLATTDPDIAAQWHPIKNGDLTPRDVTAGSNKKVWWMCDKGHEWKVSVNNRAVNGRSCPVCSGKKVLPGYNDLATTNPDLAAQWHSAKNGELGPQDVIAGSGKKVWWQCEKGHEWEATITSRSDGNGCPYCSGRNVVVSVNDLATTRPDLAAEWHPFKNGDLTPQDVKTGSDKKVWWLGPCGHEWEASVKRRGSGCGCPVCNGKAVVLGVNDLATTHPDIAAQWHPVKNGDLTPQQVVAGSNKKVWWMCDRGHEWETTVSNRRKGTGCPYCSNNRVLAAFNDLAATHPDLAAQWHPAKNRDLTPQDVTAGSNRKVWWLGTCGHEWEVAVNERAYRNTGCPFCSGKRVLPGYNDLATANPELAAQWHPTKNGELTPQDVKAGSHKKVWWLGPCGHEWEAVVGNRARKGSGCPVCYRNACKKKGDRR